MEGIWQWGLAVVISIQSVHGPILDAVFRAITFLGDEEFYLLLFPTLLWCIDARLGVRLGIIFLLSVYLNSLVKDLVAHPRPFDLDPSVRLRGEAGYGLPSGHAQNAVVIWGGLATQVRQRWAWTLAVVLPLLIGFSRVYLGAHFPTDVLAGWAIGVGLVAAAVSISARSAQRVTAWPLGGQIAIAITAPAALAVIFPDPGAIGAMGALAGVGSGFAVNARYLQVSAEGPLWKRATRLLVGAVVLIALYAGLRMIFPSPGEPLYLVFRFVRYAALGLWAGLGAPWTFSWMHLAPRVTVRPAVAGAV